MTQDAKKRQQRILRQNAKRKENQRQITRQGTAYHAPSLAKTRDWPLYEVLINQTWRDPETMTQIRVSRQGPSGNLAVGAFMVDRACLGVKAAFGRVVDAHTYASTKGKMSESQRLIRTDVNLIAKIIRDSIAYARGLGFNPDPDYCESHDRSGRGRS